MKDIIFFGAGQNAINLISLFNDKVKYFVDNNPDKQGKKIFGREVLTFNEFLQKQGSHIIIVTPGEYVGIIEQLEENGIFNYIIADNIHICEIKSFLYKIQNETLQFAFLTSNNISSEIIINELNCLGINFPIFTNIKEIPNEVNCLVNCSIDFGISDFDLCKEKFQNILDPFLGTFRTSFKLYRNVILEKFRKTNKKSQGNYELNCKLLKTYPYFFGEIPKYKNFKTSSPQQKPIDERDFPYFFENIDEPLFVENETSPYNLEYLFDNMRASEDVAMDNHIYLYYSDTNKLSEILQAANFEVLLKKEKFVFLIGEQNKTKYPLDFKTMFGKDYASMQIQPLKIDELKRLVYYRWNGNSGHSFFSHFLSIHPLIITVVANFITEKFLNNKEMLNFIEAIKTTFIDTNHFSIHYGVKTENILQELYNISLGKTYCGREWICLFAIAVNNVFLGKLYKHRIVPTIFWFPQNFNRGDEIVYNDFKYKRIFFNVRHPLAKLSTMRKYHTSDMLTKCNDLFLQNNYDAVNSVPFIPNKDDFIATYRFEDVKLYPTNALKSICKFFQVPFEQECLQPQEFVVYDYPSHRCDFSAETRKINIFDTTSLKNKWNELFSEIDILRFKLLCRDTLLNYYPTDVAPEPKTETEAYNLFMQPYSFSHLLPKDKELQFIRRLYKLFLEKRNINNENVIYPKIIEPQDFD